ncbi:MAG: hypothetical protein QNJ94_09490 [Alphaproteobacteria bacterium]|nr:hypothetical protein [Alphaproteobacteria bacterium]
MRAYIFWHRPQDGVAQPDYEAALTAFHDRLATAGAPGFRSSAAYRISAVPWLADLDGYEDWNLVDGSWALDPLNDLAITGGMAAVHGAIAEKMGVGYGGLYELIQGAGEPLGPSRAVWLVKPRGVPRQPTLSDLCATANGPVSCWRRQMVLGPAPEFAIVGGPDLTVDVPEDWERVWVDRARLGGAP